MSEPLNFSPDYSAILKGVERKFRLTQASADIDARRSTQLSTGLLATDLITRGGLLPGWSTTMGPEGSAKSTLLMHTTISAVAHNVPLIASFDYEGCVPDDTKFRVNGEDVELNTLIPPTYLESPPSEPGFLPDVTVQVDTIGGTVDASIYYGGNKETTILTLEDGTELEGADHGILIIRDGALMWEKIELLIDTDEVVTAA